MNDYGLWVDERYWIGGWMDDSGWMNDSGWMRERVGARWVGDVCVVSIHTYMCVRVYMIKMQLMV